MPNARVRVEVSERVKLTKSFLRDLHSLDYLGISLWLSLFLNIPYSRLCFVEFLLCALREGAEKKMTIHYTVLQFQSAALCIILSNLHTFRLIDQIIFYSNYAKLY